MAFAPFIFCITFVGYFCIVWIDLMLSVGSAHRIASETLGELEPWQKCHAKNSLRPTMMNGGMKGARNAAAETSPIFHTQ